MVEFSRRGGSCSAISRSGSPSGSDLAEHSIHAASTPRLTWTVGRPSSAISGATGVERGQPVMILRRSELAVQQLQVSGRRRGDPGCNGVLNRPAHVAICDSSDLCLTEPPASCRQCAEMIEAGLHLLPKFDTVFSEVERAVELYSQERQGGASFYYCPVDSGG